MPFDECSHSERNSGDCAGRRTITSREMGDPRNNRKRSRDRQPSHGTEEATQARCCIEVKHSRLRLAPVPN